MSIHPPASFCGAVLAAAVLTSGLVIARQHPGAPAPAERQGATLYVFNDSGKTLVSGKQKVKDNGHDLVNLSRHTYQKVALDPGTHVFTVPHLRKPRVELDAERGRTYYLVVAYSPSRSYVGGAAGSPVILTVITEDEAKALMQAMKEVVPQ